MTVSMSFWMSGPKFCVRQMRRGYVELERPSARRVPQSPPTHTREAARSVDARMWPQRARPSFSACRSSAPSRARQRTSEILGLSTKPKERARADTCHHRCLGSGGERAWERTYLDARRVAAGFWVEVAALAFVRVAVHDRDDEVALEVLKDKGKRQRAERGRSGSQGTIS